MRRGPFAQLVTAAAPRDWHGAGRVTVRVTPGPVTYPRLCCHASLRCTSMQPPSPVPTRLVPPAEVVAAARAAGFSGELLPSKEAAARARVSQRALLARHRRSVEAGRPSPAAFADTRCRSDGKPVVLWFPVEALDEIAASQAAPIDLSDVEAAAPPDPLGRADVVHEFELELERLRGELAAVRVERDAAAARATAAEGEAARLRAALMALAAPAPPT